MRSSGYHYIMVLTGVIAGLLSGVARADFVLVEDFEELQLGPIDDQDGWIAAHDTSVVAVDPADAGNQVLSVTTDSTYLYRPAVILNGTVRMMFLRFRLGGQQIYSFGMSDFVAPSQFGHFEPELSMSNATTELRVNDGGTYDVLTELQPNTWYNCWMLINNISDDTQVFLHARDGEPATMSDMLDCEGQTIFDFRSGSAGNLINFYIKTGGGSGPSGPLYIDDVYIENTDAVNLGNPATCVGDLDGDGVVDATDLANLLGSWGPCPACAADLNADGLIDATDLALLLGHWGPCD